MNAEALKEVIKKELPGLLREDPALRAYILELTRQEYADRAETQDRFYDILAELRRDREEQARKWDEQNQQWKDFTQEQNRKWDEQNRKWDEQNRKWDEQNQQWKDFTQEQNRKWDEQNRKWDEQNRKWDEQNRKWDEQNRLWREQWEAHQRQHKEEFDRMHEEIMALAKKHERSIGALGARWGLQSEKAFRDALAGILEQNFGVQVLNVNEYDDEGVVFGRPEQVELDVIIKNGLLLICELKSSIDKAGMYIFERKARFYERRHQCKANRLIVISPMIDARAQQVAERLGIETYGDSIEVETL
ncbi:MAG: DUF3782 domain-containing protein [Candidatus Competibacteraceae bacterium]